MKFDICVMSRGKITFRIVMSDDLATAYLEVNWPIGSLKHVRSENHQTTLKAGNEPINIIITAIP